MNVIKTKLPGVVIIEPRVFEDPRGYFMETWSKERYSQHEIPETFVQDNLSVSTKGVLRGLHYQNPGSQGKLVYVPIGEVFDVAVDIRVASPTFGQWVGVYLSSTNRWQLYIPEGLAHGFMVTSETAVFAYKCTDYYNAKKEAGIVWNDPDLGIEWPKLSPILSDKDQKYPLLRDVDTSHLPSY